jgi:hypothetical protein
MANINGIDTTVNGGLAARANGRVAPAPANPNGHAGAGVNGRTVQGDRVELSGSAREAASESLVREDLVARIRGEVQSDPDGYIDRVLNENIDVIIDGIAKDLLSG